MLERLDTVDWADLTHAYGRADDVPGQIRSLSSAEPDVREKALHALYGNIFHQGTRYEASSYAVPFLVELLADQATPDRPAILELLAHLAIGYGEAYVPSGYPVAEHRAAAAGGDTLLADSRSFVCEDDEDDEDGFDDEEDWGEDARLFQYMEALDEAEANRLHAHVELLAYDAVRAGLPLVRSFLCDENAEVRVTAAYLLGWYPEEAEASLPSLIGAASDAEQAVAATALVSIGLLAAGLGGADPLVAGLGAEGLESPGLGSAGLSDTSDPPDSAAATDVLSALEGALDDSRDVVRWGAAVGLARLRGPEAGQRVADELLGWVGSGIPSDERIPFLDGNLRGYAARAARQLDDTHTERLFAELLEQLPLVSGTEALPLTDNALRIAFPVPLAKGTPATALDDRQRRLVRVLADSPGTWRHKGLPFGNFSLLVRAYGLPGDVDAMAAYASRTSSASS